ncbi:hypothetical protein PS9374_04535 [Planomonospora sphaerica]|uniref:Uncharacterized protein n=1 Tax=Planomonospora sphaerica TaxID=161355 RepID=A0A171DJ38_9ACTN|nr:hypothetical protein [Planomonospora sphaerica]GAT68870.1 hypothetical protein PS9374_04535 [Planomonospora sphaerica]
MDEIWNGTRTADYEHTRPTGTLLEWELYTRSLIAWPHVLMDEPAPYGRLRRPGIVDIDETVHQHLVGAWHARLNDPVYAADLITRTEGARARTAAALQGLEAALEAGDPAAASAALTEATGHLLEVMSTHIVNWLLPETAWQDLLTDLLGGPAAASACGSALMTPTAPGRLLTTHLSPGPTPSATEAPAARQRALQAADAWALALTLAAAGDASRLTAARLVITLSRWAADSEERRAELRDRYLAAVPRWAALTGTDPTRLTVADLTCSGAAR